MLIHKPEGLAQRSGRKVVKAVSIHVCRPSRPFSFFFIRAAGALRTPAEVVSAFQAWPAYNSTEPKTMVFGNNGKGVK